MSDAAPLPERCCGHCGYWNGLTVDSMDTVAERMYFAGLHGTCRACPCLPMRHTLDRCRLFVKRGDDDE